MSEGGDYSVQLIAGTALFEKYSTWQQEADEFLKSADREQKALPDEIREVIFAALAMRQLSRTPLQCTLKLRSLEGHVLRCLHLHGVASFWYFVDQKKRLVQITGADFCWDPPTPKNPGRGRKPRGFTAIYQDFAPIEGDSDDGFCRKDFYFLKEGFLETTEHIFPIDLSPLAYHEFSIESAQHLLSCAKFDSAFSESKYIVYEDDFVGLFDKKLVDVLNLFIQMRDNPPDGQKYNSDRER